MIDTDKYEGHSPAPWSYTVETEDKIWDEHGAVWDAEKTCLALVNGTVQPDADLALMADAPLLLAEVKRLREGMKMMLDDMKFSKPEEEIEYWLDTWKYWLKELIE